MGVGSGRGLTRRLLHIPVVSKEENEENYYCRFFSVPFESIFNGTRKLYAC